MKTIFQKISRKRVAAASNLTTGSNQKRSLGIKSSDQATQIKYFFALTFTSASHITNKASIQQLLKFSIRRNNSTQMMPNCSTISVQQISRLRCTTNPQRTLKNAWQLIKNTRTHITTSHFYLTFMVSTGRQYRFAGKPKSTTKQDTTHTVTGRSRSTKRATQ